MLGKIDWDGFQEGFYDFLSKPLVQTKDDGLIHLEIYDTQRYFFDEVFEGLRRDIHYFICGKGRQIGITTGCQLFDVFYAGAVPNIQGVIVFDTDGNKEKFRTLINGVIASLPRTHALPLAKGGNNRRGLVFANGNMLDYLVAGTKQGSGSLGRSRAYNFGHLSECAYYGDEDALDAFFNTLSDLYEYRCYLLESTGNGYNHFSRLWDEALEDTISKKAIFVTWWRKRTYSYAKGTPLFRRYGWGELSAEEKEAATIVQREYGHRITHEQWAWYRHQADPRARADADPMGDTKREMMIQEHPHFPEQMFRGTGSPFIPAEYIGPAMARANKALFKGYRFYLGDNMVATRIDPVRFASQAHLKVWQEPTPIGVYIVGIDSAFGASEWGDGFCCQVVRCYADRVVQVAEFCDRNIQPFQFAWIALYLCGWYGNCRYVLELGSAGEAVWTEMRAIKRMVEDGTLLPPREDPENPTDVELEAEKRMKSMFLQVRQYMYHRADSLGGGYNMHMKCLALDEILPTPDGWISVGDVRPRDTLFDERGNECTVMAVSDIKEGHDCYRITFDDGSSIVADDEHLWPLADFWETRTCELRPGIDSINLTLPLATRDRTLPIHPYVLGVWLGDGHSASGRVSAHREDIEELGEHLRACGVDLSPWSQEGNGRNTCYQTIMGLQVQLRDLGVLENKHIPQIYLRGSRPQRAELLQGLMDTDGTIGVNNDRQCSFTTSNPVLAGGFAELLRSLGVKVKSRIYDPVYTYKGEKRQGATAYHFWFTGYPEAPAFKMKRKLERQLIAGRWSGMKRTKRHQILAVERVQSVPVRCIQVDSPSRLYLAGVGMIPTHNTTLESKFTFMTQFADRFMLDEFEVNSVPALKEMKTLRKDGRSIQPESKNKDDRPVTLGLCTRGYLDFERKDLIARNATIAVETARAQDDGDDLSVRFMNNIMAAQFKTKDRQRRMMRRRASGQRWSW